jgi:cellobiose phosphorylase
MINPINHTRTAEDAERYRAEPYVVAADVYAHPMHIGRGGWTWYTGSAGWFYRLIVESLLGLELVVDRLRVSPLLPPQWSGFSVRYRYRATLYHISVSRSEEAAGATETRITVDGVVVTGNGVPLVDDGHEHAVVVSLVARREPELLPAP